MDYSKSWCAQNSYGNDCPHEVQRLIDVRPSERQIEYMKMKYYNFIHFGMNTITNREWGDGSDDASLFNPTLLDTDNWCETLKNTGSKGVILTAKHHDGFCLFDTKYTDYSVMNSPVGKDIVKMLAESCEKYSLKLGLYLSPWDRHEKTYGTPEYNDFFVRQLTELCLNYGKIFSFWFDGACGEGKNGRKQLYDMERFYETIRKYQPEAVISICGPDVRWIGNEGGHTRKSEWSVLPKVSVSSEATAEKSQKSEKDSAKLSEKFDRRDEDLGSRERLKDESELVWSPAEADVSVDKGWFWHDDEYYKEKNQQPTRSPEELADIYFNTVGGNASLLLNVPPDKTGRINEREAAVLKGFADIINDAFKTEKQTEITLITEKGEERSASSRFFMLQNDEAAVKLKSRGSFRTLYIEEDIHYSQRIEQLEVYLDGKKYGAYTTVGTGKIIRFPKGTHADEIVILITQSRSNPVIKRIAVYE